MSPIVTTSTRREKTKINPLVPVMAVVILVLLFLLIRKPSSNPPTTPPATPQGTAETKPSSSAQRPSATKDGSKTTKTSTEKTDGAAHVTGVADTADGQGIGPEATGTNASPETAAGQEDKPMPMPFGVLSKQYFDNPVENRLEKLGIPGRGVAMVLPNRLSQDEILAILRRPIQINEDDDEETVAAKERTAEMKTAALEYIEAGGTYDEFIAEMVKTSNEEAEMKKTARTEMMRILKQEGYEAAEAYLEQVNPTLKEAGLKEMKIPLPFRVKHEKELERARQGN